MTENEQVICVTTDEVPGRRIVQTLGLVWGFASGARRGVNPARAGAAEQPPDDIRITAYECLVERARSIGANAVVAVRIDSNALAPPGVHSNRPVDLGYLLYGTAVVLE